MNPSIMKRSKWLTQALIISGTLNVGFLSTFIYLTLRDQQRPLRLELQQPKANTAARRLGLQEVIAEDQKRSFEELVQRLNSSEHVESGYTRRDLALSVLVSLHDFHLEKALGTLSVQQRVVLCIDRKTGEKKQLTIFPGLADYQYEAIIHYAKTERWPLTARGLFFALKKSAFPYDSSLLETFALTPQFHCIQALFFKTGMALTKSQLVQLLTAGEWEMIQQMSHLLQAGTAFDLQRRRQLLISLLASRSQLAAALLLQSDALFLLKRFDDGQMIAFLELLGNKTPALFAKVLLLSPRSDSLWKRAASILYAQAGEPLPEPYDHSIALKRFVYNSVNLMVN
jgi:hypothetical protein